MQPVGRELLSLNDSDNSGKDLAVTPQSNEDILFHDRENLSSEIPYQSSETTSFTTSSCCSAPMERYEGSLVIISLWCSLKTVLLFDSGQIKELVLLMLMQDSTINETLKELKELKDIVSAITRPTEVVAPVPPAHTGNPNFFQWTDTGGCRNAEIRAVA